MEDIMNDAVADAEALEEEKSPEQGFKTITQLTHQLVKYEDYIADLEEKLKDAKKAAQFISQTKIPETILEYGIDMKKINGELIGLADGRSLLIEDFISFSYKQRQEKVHEWLRENGNGDLIKNEIKLTYGKGEEQEAQEMYEQLLDQGLVAVKSEGVHHRTMQSFIKGMIEKEKDMVKEGQEVTDPFPKELFGVYEGKKAVIK